MLPLRSGLIGLPLQRPGCTGVASMASSARGSLRDSRPRALHHYPRPLWNSRRSRVWSDV